MKCSKCTLNDANVYIEQNINGETHKAHLCGECAYSSDILNFAPGINISQFGPVSQLHNFWFAPEKAPAPAVSKCHACGHSLADFKKTSMLGCAACYDAFEPELMGIFGKLHPGTRHVGKVPKAGGEALQKDSELTDLKSKLQSAIGNEEYEEAAKLRDIIREMEGGQIK